MKGFQQQHSHNASKSPQGFSSPSGLKSWSRNLTLFGLLSEAQPTKGVFLFCRLTQPTASIGNNNNKFDVFCWLVYFLFILFKTTQAPFSSCFSNRTILDGKMISAETIWKSFEYEVETAVTLAVDVVI